MADSSADLYEIEISAQAVRRLRKLKSNSSVLESIRISIRNLRSNPRPHGCEKLTGIDALRIRDGSYRIVYRVNDESRIVTIDSIGDRKDIYRRR